MPGAKFLPSAPTPADDETDKRRVHDTLCGMSLGGGESRGRRPEGAVNLAKRLAKSGNLQKPADETQTGTELCR